MQGSRSVVLALDNEECSRLELAAHVQGLSVEELLRAAVGLPREPPATEALAAAATHRPTD